jgi:hypothetical protein
LPATRVATGLGKAVERLLAPELLDLVGASSD